MTRPADFPRDISQEAAEWVIRRDRGLSADEKPLFDAWLGEPVHREEFLRVAASWRGLDHLTSEPSLAAAAEAVVSGVKARKARRRFTVMTGGCLAAAAAVAFGCFLWLRPVPAPEVNYQIIASTSREVTLSDGSIAMLNGDSRIETDYTPEARRIRLVQGEAHFTVAKNPQRPFYVIAGPVSVRAVGTAFNVRLGSSAVEVLVTEGRVQVNDSIHGGSLLPAVSAAALDEQADEALLVAGQQVVINLAPIANAPAQASVAVVTPAEMERSLAWQSTQLVFDDTPLDDVVTAFNHYNRRALVVGDAELGNRRITGVFRADNLDGFLRLLEAGGDVRTESRGENGTVLRAFR